MPCQKFSTGREKLALIDWHDWHVFATLSAEKQIEICCLFEHLLLLTYQVNSEENKPTRVDS